VIGAPIDVDEVAHRAIIKKSIVKIAANSGGEKTQSDMNQFMHIPAKKKGCEDCQYCNNRNCRQEIGLACEQVKSGAVINRDYQP